MDRVAYSLGMQLSKQSDFRDLGSVPVGAGPDQMYAALTMLNQARALVDPSNELKRQKLKPDQFNSMLDKLKSSKKDHLKDNRSNRVLRAITGAAAGGLGGATLGAFGGKSGIGALLGAGTGAGIGVLSGMSHDKKLLKTLKTLRSYGILSPEDLQMAHPLMRQ